MAQRVRLCLILIILLTASFSFADTRYNTQTGAKDYCLEISNESGTVTNRATDRRGANCDPLKLVLPDSALTKGSSSFTLLTGTPVGGTSTMTSTGVAVPVSSSYVEKTISSDPAFQAGTLADSDAGQTLTIFINAVQEVGNGTYVLTPTTATGFTSITFYGVDDTVTLLYVNDTLGWIILAQDGVVITR